MANEVPVKVRRSANFGNLTIGSANDETVLAAIAQTFRRTIAAGATNFEIDFPITIARVLVSAVHATGALTIYTNAASTGSPTQTITVAADATLLYNSARDPSGAKTFTANVTALYVTNAGSTDAILEIGVASSPS